MRVLSTQKSTTVRSAPWALRAAIRVGSWIAPARTAQRAMDLFCTPMASSQIRARQADAGGAVQEVLHTRGGSIQCYRWGDLARQPSVLLSHGWSSFGLRFLPWVRALQDAGYAVLAFDQPGHGRNAPARITLPGFADTVTDIGRHYGRFAAAIGHSLGGAAIAIALHDGLCADRALLIAPAADGAAASRRFARAIELPEERRVAMQQMLERKTGRVMDSLAIHRVAPELTVPALIVHDLCDQDVPWEEGERYARYWRDARLLSTDGLGHHKIVTDKTVMEAGLAFLSGQTVGERVVSTQELVYGVA